MIYIWRDRGSSALLREDIYCFLRCDSWGGKEYCPSNLEQVRGRKGNAVVSLRGDRGDGSSEMGLDVAKCREKYRSSGFSDRKLLACYTMAKQHGKLKRGERLCR